MNYSLAKEIYGIVPWFVDFKSFPVLLNSLKNNKDFESSEEKLNSIFVIPNQKTDVVTDQQYRWDGIPEGVSEAIGLVRINGPITKSGGASSYGMDFVSKYMLKMLVEKGGLAASAMYGILSGCKKIYAESEMSIIGSAGTMIQFEGRKANTESPDGTKYIRLYASKSIEKNKAWEDALNKDEYSLLINDLLDPVNENFLKMIENNRPSLKGSKFDTGEVKFAKDSVGTYIDGIESLSKVADLVMKDYQTNYKPKENQNNENNLIIQNMTAEELKQQHPETYNSIFNAGVSAEKDRTGSWMAHFGTDSESVIKGIKSGNAISQTEREELLVKAASKKTLEEIKNDSIPPVVTTESKTEEQSPEEKELEAMYSDLKGKI